MTIVNYRTEEEATKFSEEYNKDPYGGFEVRTRLVFVVNNTVQKEIKLRRKKYESAEAMMKRILSDDKAGQR